MAVVVGVDGSPASIEAIRFAAAEAALHGWKVTAVHVWGPGEVYHQDRAEAEAVLPNAVAEAVGEDAASDVELRTCTGLAHDELLDAADRADLLVVGPTGHRGLNRLVLGSVAEVCLRHATCPVAIARPRPEPAAGRVVVGVDGSPASIAALHLAATEARLREASLQIVHAYRTPFVTGYPYSTTEFDVAPWRHHAQHVIDDAMYRLGHDATARALPTLVDGDAARSLLSEAGGADLLVVGSRGLGGFSRLMLGSVGHQVAGHADCPVIVVNTKES